MSLITESYKELQPAYGRDYKSSAEAIKAFAGGQDWEGDATMGFRLCSVRNFASDVKVNLQYAKLRKVAVYSIPAEAKRAQAMLQGE